MPKTESLQFQRVYHTDLISSLPADRALENFSCEVENLVDQLPAPQKRCRFFCKPHPLQRLKNHVLRLNNNLLEQTRVDKVRKAMAELINGCASLVNCLLLQPASEKHPGLLDFDKINQLLTTCRVMLPSSQIQQNHLPRVISDGEDGYELVSPGAASVPSYSRSPSFS